MISIKDAIATRPRIAPSPDHIELRKAIRGHTKIAMQMPEFVFFWGGHYSQWATSPFYYDGHQFRTAEHFMMYHKAATFNDQMRMDMILTESDPSRVKQIGREVAGYNDDVWAEVRYGVVVAGTILKFTQNPDFFEVMVADREKVIVEASPYDKIWGIGKHENDPDDLRSIDNWDGENLLGYAIMEARERILDLEGVFSVKI